jgi:hypothetical protein
VKITTPMEKRRLAPSRSAVDPAVSISAARATVYPSTIHCNPEIEPPMLRPILGSATLTMVASS